MTNKSRFHFLIIIGVNFVYSSFCSQTLIDNWQNLKTMKKLESIDDHLFAVFNDFFQEKKISKEKKTAKIIDTEEIINYNNHKKSGVLSSITSVFSGKKIVHEEIASVLKKINEYYFFIPKGDLEKIKRTMKENGSYYDEITKFSTDTIEKLKANTLHNTKDIFDIIKNLNNYNKNYETDINKNYLKAYVINAIIQLNLTDKNDLRILLLDFLSGNKNLLSFDQIKKICGEANSLSAEKATETYESLLEKNALQDPTKKININLVNFYKLQIKETIEDFIAVIQKFSQHTKHKFNEFFFEHIKSLGYAKNNNITDPNNKGLLELAYFLYQKYNQPSMEREQPSKIKIDTSQPIITTDYETSILPKKQATTFSQNGQSPNFERTPLLMITADPNTKPVVISKPREQIPEVKKEAPHEQQNNPKIQEHPKQINIATGAQKTGEAQYVIIDKKQEKNEQKKEHSDHPLPKKIEIEKIKNQEPPKENIKIYADKKENNEEKKIIEHRIITPPNSLPSEILNTEETEFLEEEYIELIPESNPKIELPTNELVTKNSHEKQSEKEQKKKIKATIKNKKKRIRKNKNSKKRIKKAKLKIVNEIKNNEYS